MKEIIELLNHTSENRTIFYCVIFLIALGTVTTALVDIIKFIFRKK